MSKIKITERQLSLLQSIEDDKTKKKVLKITEGQYSRIFKGIIKESKTEDAPINKLEFAQELIVFIKDIMTNPKNVPFSSYWKKLGINKGQLFRMVKKEGLLEEVVDEETKSKNFASKKVGFRKKIKEVFKKITEKENINELGDAGYPAGAENDSRAQYNEPNDEPHYDNGPIKAEKEIVSIEYFNEEADGLAIFKSDNNLLAIVSANLDGELLADYEDVQGYPDGDTLYNYVNHQLESGQLEIYDNVKALEAGKLSMVTPEVKGYILNLFGGDENLVQLLSQLPETTGAGSSGAYVGGMSGGPIQKNTGISPEKAMKSLNEEGIDPSYTHFAVFKIDGKIANGWDYKGVDDIDIKEYSKIDLRDDYPDNKPSEFTVLTVVGMKKRGIDPFDSNNWYKHTIGLGETTTTVSAGGDSGTFAYDAPAGDGTNFWTAGNKLNKKGDSTPVIKRPIGKVAEGIKVGQIYKNGVGRIKIEKANPLSNQLTVRRWGDVEATTINISAKDMSGWVLLEGKKVLKITEDQLKRVLESDNQSSTAYPNGEMIDIDDCTKLNNNKVAQNGGCSQGAIDNVVKTKKTKDSVVAELAKRSKKSINEINSIIENDVNSKLVPLLVQAIEQVDENLGYDEFAKAVGTIIKDQYGAHLIKPFMKMLNSILINEPQSKESEF